MKGTASATVVSVIRPSFSEDRLRTGWSVALDDIVIGLPYKVSVDAFTCAGSQSSATIDALIPLPTDPPTTADPAAVSSQDDD